MSGEFRNRIHRRGELFHASIENAILTSGMLIGMLTTLIVLWLGVWVSSR